MGRAATLRSKVETMCPLGAPRTFLESDACALCRSHAPRQSPGAVLVSFSLCRDMAFASHTPPLHSQGAVNGGTCIRRKFVVSHLGTTSSLRPSAVSLPAGLLGEEWKQGEAQPGA